jgi:hypothetical protein
LQYFEEEKKLEVSRFRQTMVLQYVINESCEWMYNECHFHPQREIMMFSSRKQYCYGKIRSMKADGGHRAFLTCDLIANQIIEMLTIVNYENKLFILKTNYET